MDDPSQTAASESATVEAVQIDEIPSQVANVGPRDRDRDRFMITVVLLGLIAAVIIATFTFIAFDLITPAEAKDLLPYLLSPLITLFGAAIGFYFAEHRTSR